MAIEEKEYISTGNNGLYITPTIFMQLLREIKDSVATLINRPVDGHVRGG